MFTGIIEAAGRVIFLKKKRTHGAFDARSAVILSDAKAR